jgi:thiamine pyrophosphate-dependent acetolactate synthase large subunit-like protein
MTKTRMLERRDTLARLLAGRRELLVVSGLGAPTYDVAAAGDHARNFYLWGAMGGAAMVGYGLALARPRTPVLVVTGDGEMLMGMGALATIAVRNPGNLTILVLDNGLYGETGGQRTHTAHRTDLAAVARGCGIGEVRTLGDVGDVDALAPRVHAPGHATCVAIAGISADEPARVLPSRDGVFVKNRFREALGLSSG